MMLQISVDETETQPSIAIDEFHNDKENGQTKRKRFNLLPSLFRSSRLRGSSSSFRRLGGNLDEMLNDSQLGVPFPITDSCLIPGSPISPRVKNFNSDMRNLAMSRTDNPYISQQMERSSTLSYPDQSSSSSDYALSTPMSTPILSVRKCGSSSYRNYFSPKKSTIPELTLHLKLDERDHFNLHDKLIRSPPPNFPEKLSHFTFTESHLLEEIAEPDRVMTNGQPYPNDKQQMW